MTQQPERKLSDYRLIIPEKDGPSYNQMLVIACRGNSKIADLLKVFLNRGNFVAMREDLKLDQIEHILFPMTHEEILKQLNGVSSEKTLIGQIKKLQEWKFLRIERHKCTQYFLYFRQIRHDIANPPEPEPSKLRGYPSHKTTCNITGCEVDSIDYANETAIQAISSDTTTCNITTCSNEALEVEQPVKLQEQVVILQLQLVKLQESVVKLQLDLSNERASREALEVKFEALYNIYNNNTNNNTKEERKNAKASDDQTDPSKHSSRKRSQKRDPQETVSQPALPQEPEKQGPVLSERGQAIFDEWCKQPRFKRARPNLTEKAIGHCNALAVSCDPLPTAEEMVKTGNWYQKKHPEHRGWHLGNLKDAYPQWLSENYQEPLADNSTPVTTVQPTMSEAQAQALAAKAIAMAKGQDHEIQALVEGDKVVVQWNTPGFNRPQTFTSETAFMEIFQVIAKLWNDSKKKLNRKAI